MRETDRMGESSSDRENNKTERKGLQAIQGENISKKEAIMNKRAHDREKERERARARERKRRRERETERELQRWCSNLARFDKLLPLCERLTERIEAVVCANGRRERQRDREERERDRDRERAQRRRISHLGSKMQVRGLQVDIAAGEGSAEIDHRRRAGGRGPM
jgi:hypothetical protein